MNGLKILQILSIIFILTVNVSGQLATKNASGVKQFFRSEFARCDNQTVCPTWFTCNSRNQCQCENSDGDGIVCDNKRLLSAILILYCVTYDEKSGSTFLGPCFYNVHTDAFNSSGENDKRKLYHYLPKNPSKLINHSACTHFHRTGLLCGECEPKYSPLVLSYNLSCVLCPNGQKNWWKFVLAGFLPLTLFYLFMVLFNINVTSSRLHGVVWASQMLSMPKFVRPILQALEFYGELKLGKALTVFYSYWNLDFFHSILPNICLNVSTLQVLALEYLIALYPFVLIAISYVIIAFYDKRDSSALGFMWRPFQKFRTKLQKYLDVRTSVIDSFSTFFLLSYIKVLSVTSDILTPIQIQKLGSNEKHLAVYFSPTIDYFGDEHLPYAILAITITTVFVTIPTVILILYPCPCFQKVLSLIPIRWHFLHAFVDSFQGCYKDGTEPGTLDCRWFSVIRLIINPVLFLVFGWCFSAMYFIYALIVLLIVIVAMVNIQPHKMTVLKHLSTDTMFLSQICLMYIAILGRQSSRLGNYQHYHTVWVVASLTVGFVPIIYTFYLIGMWLFTR